MKSRTSNWVFAPVLGTMALTGCAESTLRAPDLFRVDIRSIPMPMMMNDEQGEPAGRTIVGVGRKGSRITESTSTTYTAFSKITVYTREEERTASKEAPGPQIAAQLQPGDRYGRVRGILMDGYMSSGMEVTDLAGLVGVECSVFKGKADR
jgi:hypothetical protein